MVSPAGAPMQHAPLSTHADPDSSLRTPQLDWPRMFPCGPFGAQRAVINHGTDMSSTTPPITDQTLSRQDLEALLAGRTAALTCSALRSGSRSSNSVALPRAVISSRSNAEAA